MSEVTNQSSTPLIIVKGGGDHSAAASQTNSFVNWRRRCRGRVPEKLGHEKVPRRFGRGEWEAPAKYESSSSAGSLSAGWPAVRRLPTSSCHVASRPAYPGPPSPQPSRSLSGKGWKSWSEPQSFISPALPPPSCWQLCRSSQNMRTLFEKGFTAHFKTQDWKSIYQSGGVFLMRFSLK